MTIPASTQQPVESTSLDRRALLRRVAAAGLAAPVLAALVSSGTFSSAAAPAGRATNPSLGSLDAVLAAAVEAGLPGVTLYVERSGEPLYSGAAGVASIEQETPLKATDRFRIYSIAKTFTAIVTLQLVDEGVLSLDDAVTRWLDDPAVLRIPNVSQITLRHLLIHTSGIYDFADDDSPFWADAFLGPSADWTKVWTPLEMLAYADFANHAPYFAPGDGYHYSNTGYVLLGLVVEQATGRAFRDELQARILEPLALNDTFLVEGRYLPDGTVDAYQVIEGALVNVSGINLSWDWTAGGMVSTAADLARFARAVFAGDLLSAASFAEMFTFIPTERPAIQEGMGVYRGQGPIGELVGMDGSGPGGTSNMMRFADAELIVIVLANLAPDDGATETIRDEAIRVVNGPA